MSQRGLCFVRARSVTIVLTTYGRSSGYCTTDREETAQSFLPGTPILSFGTAGCNLTCKFCQNWDISKSREVDWLMDQAAPELIELAAKHTGCRSVAYTYNDPTIFLEYAVDVGHACHAHDIKNVAVTAGYIKEKAREDFFSVIDAAHVDLKAFRVVLQSLCTAELGAVLDTLKYLSTNAVWFEITTLDSGENDSPAEIEAMTQWIRENSTRCARPFHGLPSGLPHARQAAYAARDLDPGLADRAENGIRMSIRQYSR